MKQGIGAAPVTGRLFVVFTRDNSREPRLQAGGYGGSVPFFAVDVDALTAGSSASVTPAALGFPLNGLKDVPAGSYYVQAVLNVYTRVTPKHGKTIWVHWDQWEGQKWNRSPGNLVSEVQQVSWDPASSVLKLELSKVLPPIQSPPDTRWVKRVKIQSKMLTEWWGHPV